ncbi:MAG: hydroxyethylthiazole kinase [Pseudorhodoplanes sp.]|uniref:hydroxyethylthiazole kinase n=1 Tax=Pseudorhodoplanes sp. TaxID=1934341 RepID=UPI003D0B8941
MHAPQGDSADVVNLADHAADLIERLRVRQPRVHCITNAVAQNLTANVLLAVGALPSMTIARSEVTAFATRADALLVNLGTFDPERRAAADAAIATIRSAARPWILDPVLIDRSPPRAAYAHTLLAHRPSAIRMNAAEFTELCGEASPQTFAREQRTVVAITGETDLVTDGDRTFRIANGHPLMARVTAMGCAESALVAATLAVQPDPLKAVASALLIFGIAGDIAGETANGPGTFGVHILDALFNLDRATILARAKVTS